jgi:hypothetical protein
LIQFIGRILSPKLIYTSSAKIKNLGDEEYLKL